MRTNLKDTKHLFKFGLDSSEILQTTCCSFDSVFTENSFYTASTTSKSQFSLQPLQSFRRESFILLSQLFPSNKQGFVSEKLGPECATGGEGSINQSVSQINRPITGESYKR